MCGGVTEIYWSTCGGLLDEYVGVGNWGTRMDIIGVA